MRGDHRGCDEMLFIIPRTGYIGKLLCVCVCVGVFEEWRRQETEVGTSAKDNERNDEQQKNGI